MKKSLMIILICFSGLFANVHLSFDNVNISEGTLDIYMENDDPVGGFQFTLEGVSVTATSGGSAEANGFLLSSSETTSIILGFSLTGATIPTGSGVLLTVDFTGFTDEICFIGVVISDPVGSPLQYTISNCYSVTLGCTDSNACNYDPNAMEDNGSCAYEEDCAGECGGDAVVDECGECEGDGPEENFDCNGNCLVEEDCNGECGGSAVEDCNGECDGDAIEDVCGVCDGSTTDISECLEHFIVDLNWTGASQLNIFQNSISSPSCKLVIEF